MTLVLPGNIVEDYNIQQKFDTIALKWTDPSGLNVVGATGQPAFLNAWVNLGGGFVTAGFYRDRDRVYLQGTIKTGAIGTVAFTLPVGYRPTAATNFACASGIGTGVCTVSSNGSVQPVVGVNTDFSLDTISFRAA